MRYFSGIPVSFFPSLATRKTLYSPGEMESVKVNFPLESNGAFPVIPNWSEKKETNPLPTGFPLFVTVPETVEFSAGCSGTSILDSQPSNVENTVAAISNTAWG